MNTIASTSRYLLAAAIVSLTALGTAFTTDAAVITWGAATNIAGDTDVNTNGTLVGALNLGAAGVATTTINGVTFTGVAVSGNNVTSGNFNLATAASFSSFTDVGPNVGQISTLSASYKDLLRSTTVAAPPGASFTLTMSGLVVGEIYEFQWFLNNSFSGQFNNTATAGNSVTLVDNVTKLNGGTGQFAIGTFIADNASQQITFGGPDTNGINGFQLRQTSVPVSAVPEPGSALVGMLALGLCGVGVTRRRRA